MSRNVRTIARRSLVRRRRRPGPQPDCSIRYQAIRNRPRLKTRSDLMRNAARLAKKTMRAVQQPRAARQKTSAENAQTNQAFRPKDREFRGKFGTAAFWQLKKCAEQRTQTVHDRQATNLGTRLQTARPTRSELGQVRKTIITVRATSDRQTRRERRHQGVNGTNLATSMIVVRPAALSDTRRTSPGRQ